MTNRNTGKARHVFGILAVLFTLLGNTVSLGAQEPATPESGATPGGANGAGQPASCLVGLAVESIHNLNLVDETFDADFWIWSVCEDDRFRPISTMEFVNSNRIEMSLDGEEAVDGLHWRYAHVSGTFRHHWDLIRYPFDEQVFQVIMEDTAYESGDFMYDPDPSDLIPIPESERGLDHWNLVDTTLEAGSAHYMTSFGDPRSTDGTSDYPRLVLSLTFERDEMAGFIKLTFVVYIAFLVSLISYFLRLDGATLLLARFSVISATLFAVTLNLNRVTSELATEDGLTLVDRIHFVALVAFLVDAGAALMTHLRLEQGRPAEELNRFNRQVMASVVIGFVAINAVLIGMAAIG